MHRVSDWHASFATAPVYPCDTIGQLPTCTGTGTIMSSLRVTQPGTNGSRRQSRPSKSHTAHYEAEDRATRPTTTNGARSVRNELIRPSSHPPSEPPRSRTLRLQSSASSRQGWDGIVSSRPAVVRSSARALLHVPALISPVPLRRARTTGLHSKRQAVVSADDQSTLQCRLRVIADRRVEPDEASI
jgi:hypothetical protein